MGPTGPDATQDERATADPDVLKMTPRTVELARCYVDVFFHRFPRPFPWTNWNCVEESLAVWPVKRILEEDCPAEFLHTIDFLAGRRDSPYA